MLQSLREETEGKLQMLLTPRKNSITSLFKEVRVFEVQESLLRLRRLFLDLPTSGETRWRLFRDSQGHPFLEIFGGFWCLVSAVHFWVDFFVDFSGPFSLGKQARKNSPKNPPKNPRVSRQLFDQNPLREISAPVPEGSMIAKLC